MPAKPTSPHQWTPWHPVVLALFMTLGILATLDAWRDILRIVMRDEESSHIWLVPFIAAWLVWRRRGRLRRCTPGGLLLGPIVILFGAALYLIGAVYLIQSPWHT